MREAHKMSDDSILASIGRNQVINIRQCEAEIKTHSVTSGLTIVINIVNKTNTRFH